MRRPAAKCLREDDRGRVSSRRGRSRRRACRPSRALGRRGTLGHAEQRLEGSRPRGSGVSTRRGRSAWIRLRRRSGHGAVVILAESAVRMDGDASRKRSQPSRRRGGGQRGKRRRSAPRAAVRRAPSPARGLCRSSGGSRQPEATPTSLSSARRVVFEDDLDGHRRVFFRCEWRCSEARRRGRSIRAVLGLGSRRSATPIARPTALPDATPLRTVRALPLLAAFVLERELHLRSVGRDLSIFRVMSSCSISAIRRSRS